MTERRRMSRAEMAVPCVLRRRTGSAISVETVNVGPGGMCVATERPLAIDEVLEFDLPVTSTGSVDGHARVLRHEGHGVYALRFEDLRAPTREQLQTLLARPGAEQR